MGAFTDEMLRELRRTGSDWKGYADAAASAGKGALLTVPSGYAGLLEALRTGSLDEGIERIERFQKISAPQTEKGAKNLQAVGEGIEAVGDYFGNPIDKVGDLPVVGPILGAATQGFIEVADPSKGVGKAARAAKAAAKAAVGKAAGKAPVVVEKVVERNPDMKVLEPPEMEVFGNKAKREAAAKRKLGKQEAAAQADDVTPVKRQTGGRTGTGKVAPDVFRQQYAAAATPEEGYQSVLASALREEHMKPAPGGGWVGMPRTVKNRRDLARVRDKSDKQFDEAWAAVGYADPERQGTWYPRAKAGHADIWEPWQYDRGLEGTAGYSAGVSPEAEHAFNLKHQNSRAVGIPKQAYRADVMNTLDDAVAQGVKADLGHKVGEYRGKNDTRSDALSPFGVNDFRYAQNSGYTDPQGNPWKVGVTDQMHPAMDLETVLGVERARARHPGKTITGEVRQEIPWVMDKAEDFYERGKNSTYKAKFEGDVSGKVQALRDANRTADFFPKHALTTTHEYVPGADTGHVPQVRGMDEAGKRAYAEQGRWDTEGPMSGMDWHALDRANPQLGGSPRGAIKAGSVGAGPRDAIIRGLGLPQQNPLEGTGQYTNNLGGVENNPVYMPRTQVDFMTVPDKPRARTLKDGTVIEPTPKELAAFEAVPVAAPGTINPDTLAALRFGERTRGYIDAQENVAGNLPVTHAARAGRTSLLMERGTRPSAQELEAMTARIAALRAAEDAKIAEAQDKVRGPLPFSTPRYDPYMGVTPTNRGALVLNKGGMPLRPGDRAALSGDMPGAVAQSADFEGFYEPAMTSAADANQGLGMERLLNEAAHDTPPEAVRGLSESEEIRRLIREKMDRDAALPGARADIAEGRRFLAVADWNKAVEMIRKGMKPAAAVAALGYSLQSMAAEDEQALMAAAQERQ